MTVDLHQLADELVGWMPTQRWFAGKNRPVRAVEPLEFTALIDGDPQLLHTVVEVAHTDGGTDRYQLLLGVRDHLPDNLVHGSIGMAGGHNVYDAIYDHDLTDRLPALFASSAEIGPLRFEPMPDAELDLSLRARPIGVEQSNTSLVYGQRYILKVFRRLQPGLSPDVELHRALHQVGCGHIAAPLGWITGSLDDEQTTLAMLGEFLPNAADGWAMATASVRDLLAEADLHAHEVGGDFAGEARRLGHAVATVHADLDRALGHTDASGDWLVTAVAGMHSRLDAMLRTVPSLAPYESRLRKAFDAAGAQRQDSTRLQRIHGDLHLGQTLRTPLHWVLIDFEGEPSVPLARRRELSSPLRDVAGMLRSFDYAALHMLVGHSERHLAVRAAEWSERNRDAFCDGYAEVASDPREHNVLLRALELDKAVYEVGYEAAHRPDWQAIPLASIERLLTGSD